MKKIRNSAAVGMCGLAPFLFLAPAEVAPVTGVFPPLVNKVAFIDRLMVGIGGELRRRANSLFTVVANPAIGGPGRPYARSLHYIYQSTGNPFEVRYGPNPMYPNLFDAKVVIRSEGRAISQKEVTGILQGLFRKGYRHVVQGVEFTSDVSVPFGFFENHIITRARSVRTLTDDSSGNTLYAGAPATPWMLRVYQKTKEITRVEFVLRRSFLAKARIGDLQSLQRLRELPMDRMVAFPAVCRCALEDLLNGKVSGKRLQLIREWPDRRPSGILLDILKDYGLRGELILRRSPVEHLLEEMQKSFIWESEGA